jgi:NitT/TauT family transport system substrate-binding protein
MGPPQTRRQFLSTLSLAGATALFGVRPTALADEPPETRTIRFAKNASICVFPQFYLQETLRAEGFSEIGYIETSAVRTLEPIARGTADFAVSFGLGQILEIDAGSPITILGGVHVGCDELFARESIRSVPELKGKSVGLETASPALLKLMAANVGLDPENDFNWVTDRKLKPLELFAAWKHGRVLSALPRGNRHGESDGHRSWGRPRAFRARPTWRSAPSAIIDGMATVCGALQSARPGRPQCRADTSNAYSRVLVERAHPPLA